VGGGLDFIFQAAALCVEDEKAEGEQRKLLPFRRPYERWPRLNNPGGRLPVSAEIAPPDVKEEQKSGKDSCSSFFSVSFYPENSPPFIFQPSLLCAFGRLYQRCAGIIPG
jgi:hypothetical protein